MKKFFCFLRQKGYRQASIDAYSEVHPFRTQGGMPFNPYTLHGSKEREVLCELHKETIGRGIGFVRGLLMD